MPCREEEAVVGIGGVGKNCYGCKMGMMWATQSKRRARTLWGFYWWRYASTASRALRGFLEQPGRGNAEPVSDAVDGRNRDIVLRVDDTAHLRRFHVDASGKFGLADFVRFQYREQIAGEVHPRIQRLPFFRLAESIIRHFRLPDSRLQALHSLLLHVFLPYSANPLIQRGHAAIVLCVFFTR